MNRKLNDDDKRLAIAWFHPSATLYTVLTNVSRSGMSRSIKVLASIVNQRGPNDALRAEVVDVSWLVAKILDWSTDPRHGGVKVGGCGSDMGFEIVHNLSYAMHGIPNAPIEKQRCLDYRDDVEHGYSLQHRWL